MSILVYMLLKAPISHRHRISIEVEQKKRQENLTP